MTQIITGLLSSGTWETIFLSFFFFGLFFFILAIYGSFGDHDGPIHGDSDADLIDMNGDGIPDGIDTTGDGAINVHFDTDGSIDSHLDHGFDHGHDLSHTASDHIGIDSDMKSSDNSEFIFIESKYKLGEYASFSMFFGMTGWFYVKFLTDLQLGLAIIIGFVAMRTFAYVIASYTQTVTKAVRGVSRGDIAQVRYKISPVKSGLVTIYRKDGVLATELARGAFPYDTFEKGEKGYVWDRTEKGVYLVTRGIIGQPDLNTTKKTKSKAMDTKAMDTKAMDTKAMDNKAMDEFK